MESILFMKLFISFLEVIYRKNLNTVDVFQKLCSGRGTNDICNAVRTGRIDCCYSSAYRTDSA